ncbi:MAG: hypothetical protein ABIQ66_11050 [Novosphingobium sp.]
METMLYLLISAGFFMLMMRFGCGAHVMGHNQHRDHEADERHEGNGPSRPASNSHVHEDRPAR